jgi:PAS domain-containing protein
MIAPITSHRRSLAASLNALLIAVMLGGTALFFYEQEQAEKLAAQFRTAVRGAGAGQWYWDIDKNILRWDARMFELLHCSKSGWEFKDGAWEWRGALTDEPASKFVVTLYEEDAPMVMAALQRAVMSKTSYQAVFRIKGRDGQLYYIRAGGAVYGGGRYMTGLCLKFNVVDKPGELDISSALQEAKEHMDAAAGLWARHSTCDE